MSDYLRVFVGEKCKVVTPRGDVSEFLVTETRVDYGLYANVITVSAGGAKGLAMQTLGLKAGPEDLVRILFQAYFGCADKQELRKLLRGVELP